MCSSDLELGTRRDIRILIGRDDLSGLTRQGDPTEGRPDRPPIGFAARLEVRDVNRNVRGFAYGERPSTVYEWNVEYLSPIAWALF